MNRDEITTSYDEDLAAIGQALAHPTRIQILRLLAHGERCGCEIAPYFDLNQSGISRHLNALRRAGLIMSRRDGARIYWRTASLVIPALLNLLEAIVKKSER